MTKTKDGGPAFPHSAELHPSTGDVHTPQGFGMSLRDWFAGQAASTLLDTARVDSRKVDFPEHIATLAYAFADAMLAERERQP